MGRIKDRMLEDDEVYIDTSISNEREYPIKMNVDGYDVNHYYDGDVPIYEIYDENGDILEVAHSTNEMHEITRNK